MNTNELPPRNLSNYDSHNLSQRIETSHDISDGKKAQSLLNAKVVIDLKDSIRDLQLQVAEASKNIRGSIKYSAEQLAESVNRFSANVEKYSISTDKYYTAIIILTAGLVLVGIANIIIEFFK